MGFRNDPLWQRISASKRGNKIYFKLPHGALEVMAIEIELALAYQDSSHEEFGPVLDQFSKLVEEAKETLTRAIVFELSLVEAQKELDLFLGLVLQTERGRLEEYMNVLRGGIAGSPELDWIKRIQTPSTE